MKRPQSIVVASTALALAVGAGIVESALAVVQIATSSGLSLADDVQIAVRGVVYAAGLVLAFLLYRRRRWARWALLIMLGLLWSVTLVIPMLGELGGGTGLWTVLGGEVDPVFPVVRSLHLVLVPVGLIAMFRPAASRYLQPQTGRASLVS
ncbi:hypothetical protein [Microlunatus sp. Gsoil 973]|uniref:hypothetical protein n=1 Tax=Microlunatus sp. Gsoil 973 TaxID=2672569 RepID=UPI0012B45554|nr:hypothetical protein [Microlunatus sp. Gsoil 973]QGN34038.1 hypothetical protein GJV80_15810 [Microlunatus sp. Gsoil 973]